MAETTPRKIDQVPERRAVRPLSEAEVAVTILDEILGYPDIRALKDAIRNRNPNLGMEDRLARARALVGDIPSDSLRQLFDRLGGPGPVHGSQPFTYYSETDRITWSERLISALYNVSVLDPERDPDELLDAICDQVLHLSGWRGIRLYVIDEVSLTITAVRDCRIRPLVEGRPSPQGTIIRDRILITQELPKSPDEPPSNLESWAYWNGTTAVVEGPDSPLLKQMARKLPPDIWENKTTIFHPIKSNMRTGGATRQPIAILATACVPGDVERSLSWIEASPFLDVVSEQLSRWARYHLGRRQRQSDLRSLSNRELEMLSCIGDGLSTEQTGHKLGISVQTVKTHRRRLREKLGIRNEAELVKLAIQTGLTSSV